MKEKRALQLKIELKYTSPPVSRTIALPIDATLHQLHECIQIMFGWYNIHPYAFCKYDTVQRYVYDIEAWEEAEDDEGVYLSSEENMIGECFKVGGTWLYVYDFGDEWQHKITIEKEFPLEQPGKPKLIGWEGDNLCEDAGGTTGYYEKLEIMENPRHENYQDIKSFMERNHQEFQVNRVQFELMSLEKDFYAHQPHLCIADYCNDIFMLTARDTLFHVKAEKNKDLYIWFNDHDETKCVYFFQNEKDFIHSYFSNIEHDSVYPLYFSGYRLNYPNFKEIDDLDLPGELLRPQLRKYKAGIGEIKITDAERDEIKEITVLINDLIPEFCEQLITFPDISEQKKIYIVVDEDTVEYRIGKLNVQLKMTPKRLTQKDEALLKEKKHTKERLHMNLLSITDIIEPGYTSHYYIAASGSTTGFLHALKHHEMKKAMNEIKDRFIAYMSSCGIPATLYVSDYHLYQLFGNICETLNIDLIYCQCNQEIVMEQYEEAMVEQNPIEQFDQELLEKIIGLSDEELIHFIEEQTDEKMKQLLKQILFMNIFIKE